jgi:hypothetical protein
VVQYATPSNNYQPNCNLLRDIPKYSSKLCPEESEHVDTGGNGEFGDAPSRQRTANDKHIEIVQYLKQIPSNARVSVSNTPTTNISLNYLTEIIAAFISFSVVINSDTLLQATFVDIKKGSDLF